MTLSLSSCLLGPNYEPPPTPVPECWSYDPGPLSPLEEPCIEWWTLFDDPFLDCYIAQAVSNNQDILAAEAAICQARAVRQVTAAPLFPQINADLNYTRTYFSKNGPIFAISMGQTNINTGLPFQLQVPQIQNLYNALIDASWEIDIFGKTRRAVEAADAKVGSAIENRNDLLVTIMAEVALDYIELRSLQQQGALVEEYVSLLEKTAEIIAKRLEVGYTNRLDLERIKSEIALNVALLPGIYSQIYQMIYAISVLTGALPETLLCELLPRYPLMPLPSHEIAVGLRSDLIRRRPDIRYAERQLAAATANIGVAVASFFPSFTLNGDIGFQSLSLSNLFQAQSLTWAIGGDINVPIYHGGSLRGNLRIAEAQAVEALFHYEQIVLRALRESESAIVAYSEDSKTWEQLTAAIAHNQEIVFLSNERYIKGLVSLTDLLDSERQLNSIAQDRLNSQTGVLIDLVILFKAIGGGWEIAPFCP